MKYPLLMLHVLLFLARKAKNKHQYDSDEEIDDDLGTWEHQNRRLEMTKTQGSSGNNSLGKQKYFFSKLTIL